MKGLFFFHVYNVEYTEQCLFGNTGVDMLIQLRFYLDRCRDGVMSFRQLLNAGNLS